MNGNSCLLTKFKTIQFNDLPPHSCCSPMNCKSFEDNPKQEWVTSDEEWVYRLNASKEVFDKIKGFLFLPDFQSVDEEEGPQR